MVLSREGALGRSGVREFTCAHHHVRERPRCCRLAHRIHPRNSLFLFSLLFSMPLCPVHRGRRPILPDSRVGNVKTAPDEEDECTGGDPLAAQKKKKKKRNNRKKTSKTEAENQPPMSDEV